MPPPAGAASQAKRGSGLVASQSRGQGALSAASPTALQGAAASASPPPKKHGRDSLPNTRTRAQPGTVATITTPLQQPQGPGKLSPAPSSRVSGQGGSKPRHSVFPGKASPVPPRAPVQVEPMPATTPRKPGQAKLHLPTLQHSQGMAHTTLQRGSGGTSTPAINLTPNRSPGALLSSFPPTPHEHGRPSLRHPLRTIRHDHNKIKAPRVRLLHLTQRRRPLPVLLLPRNHFGALPNHRRFYKDPVEPSRLHNDAPTHGHLSHQFLQQPRLQFCARPPVVLSSCQAQQEPT